MINSIQIKIYHYKLNLNWLNVKTGHILSIFVKTYECLSIYRQSKSETRNRLANSLDERSKTKSAIVSDSLQPVKLRVEYIHCELHSIYLQFQFNFWNCFNNDLNYWLNIQNLNLQLIKLHDFVVPVNRSCLLFQLGR